MSIELLAVARFVLGLVVIAGAFLVVRRARGQTASDRAWSRLLESRLHYGLAGAVAGATAWPDLQPLFTESAAIAVAFFGAWCGLVIGLGLDLRSLGRSAAALLLLEAGQVALVVAGVLVTTSLFGRLLGPGRLPFTGSALLVLAGICAVGVPLRRRSGGGVPDKVGRSGWEPSVSGWIGILLIGLGSTRLHDLAFAVRLPFQPESRALPVDSLAAETLWTLVIGAVTGLAIDLATRDSDRTELVFIVAGGLAFGGGLAAVLGLEPLWVGVVAGGWVINATLRRLEVIRVADRVHPVMRIGLFFTAGWVLGQGIGRTGVDLVVSLWVFAVIVGLRPVAAVAETRLVRRLLHVPAVKRSREHDWLGPGQEDLALVAAVGLAVLWNDPAGVGTVLGVLAAVCALRLFRGAGTPGPLPE